MHHHRRPSNLLFDASLRPGNAAFAILILLLFLVFLLLFMTFIAPPAQAQTYKVIYNFTGGADRGNPYAGLTMDAAGNLYGTTCGALCYAGADNAGTVFRLSKNGSGWVFTTLYLFRGGTDGAGPYARVILGPDGTLYGTTYQGGGNGCGGSGCGTVFNLKPPSSISPTVFGGWKETILYSFQGGNDGSYPVLGDLVFDKAGNLYGTTAAGGPSNAGTVFQLTPSVGGWKESVLYAFTGGSDGNSPLGGLILDGAGNLYGTTQLGGSGSCSSYNFPCGVVFELTPSASGWTEEVLERFQGGVYGGNPIGGLAQGPLGIIGTTSLGGYAGGGTAFDLNRFYDFNYSFPGGEYGAPWPGPWASLVYGPIDAPGVAYGTTYGDGAYQYGSAFYMYGCDGWDAVTLHDFTGGADGAYPVSNLIFDASDNIFGTTSAGGAYGLGVVFEITPASGSQIAAADSSGCANGQ